MGVGPSPFKALNVSITMVSPIFLDLISSFNFMSIIHMNMWFGSMNSGSSSGIVWVSACQMNRESGRRI